MGAYDTTLGNYLVLFDFHLHPYGMHLAAEGLSHGLNKCPPDTCLHQCATGAVLSSPRRIKKSRYPFGYLDFLVRRKGLVCIFAFGEN